VGTAGNPPLLQVWRLLYTDLVEPRRDKLESTEPFWFFSYSHPSGKSTCHFQGNYALVGDAALRASPVVLYCKPESGKKWKDVNCSSGQQGKSLYSSFIYRLKPGFGRFFRGLVNGFGMFCFGKTLRFGRTTFS
jgi:hypothetical protein